MVRAFFLAVVIVSVPSPLNFFFYDVLYGAKVLSLSSITNAII